MALPRIACILGAAVCAVSAQYSIQHQILADPSAIEAQKQIYLAQIQADLEEQTRLAGEQTQLQLAELDRQATQQVADLEKTTDENFQQQMKALDERSALQ